mgnify:CR=1 FL=1
MQRELPESLKNLPDYFIEQSGEEGLDCTRIYILQEDVLQWNVEIPKKMPLVE